MFALVRRPKGRGAPKVKPGGILPSVFGRGWTHCVCLASGPSLTQAQVDLVAAARPQWRVLVVNNTWERMPDADVLYACDQSWWQVHAPTVRERFHGECWTASRFIAHRERLHHVRCVGAPGLSKEIGVVHSGHNSGYQAVNLAYLFGAQHILLAGYDMQFTYGMSHWHGDHVGLLHRGLNTSLWIKSFEPLATDLADAGVRVVNCSISTALDCFPKGDLAACLSSFAPE